jgi:hypothetical protein
MTTSTLHFEADHRRRLRALAQPVPSVTSVYLRATAPGHPHDTSGRRWMALRCLLEDRGTPRRDLAVLDQAVRGLGRGDFAVFAVVCAGRLQLRMRMDGFDEPDSATFGRWVRCLPLLRWEQQQGAGAWCGPAPSVEVEGFADVGRALDFGAVSCLVVVRGAAPGDMVDAMVCTALSIGAEVVVAEPGDVELLSGVGASLRF